MLKNCKCYFLLLFISVTFSASGATKQLNEIKLSFIGDTDSQAFMGVQQGIDEANVQGLFLGQRYSLITSPNLSRAILTTVDAKSIAKLSKMY
ncbi:MAG: hypothetical protein JKX76_09135, partial [Colwellia sp.]|nr:hypothetical protein [Colwellia sp.]